MKELKKLLTYFFGLIDDEDHSKEISEGLNNPVEFLKQIRTIGLYYGITTYTSSAAEEMHYTYLNVIKALEKLS